MQSFLNQRYRDHFIRNAGRLVVPNPHNYAATEPRSGVRLTVQSHRAADKTPQFESYVAVLD
jgi:hypothetical protein